MSNGRRWLNWELDFLRQCYADNLTEALAVVLKCGVSRVSAKANGMGLKKNPLLLAEIARLRTLEPGHGSQRTRFRPGIVPANKGLRRPGWAPGRMATTQFKPGSKPVTWVPVGTLRINEGALERKFADVPGPPHWRWKACHTLLWIEAHGPVPAGHVVTFKHGRHTTELAHITLDAVELITRAELMARNSIHNLPGPLKEVVQLSAQLTRQINRRAKEDA